MELSSKGQELIQLYKKMAEEGYVRVDGSTVATAFSDFELRVFRPVIRECFQVYEVSTVLDYGCGGSDWNQTGFDEESGKSAIDFFQLRRLFRYEPARGIDERQPVDCVVCFDVLEHVFISDVANTLRDIFSCSTKLLILNVACYPAGATLPNGENAHITVRPPLWWKGMIDGIASEYPATAVLLYCSTAYRNVQAFPIFSGNQWLEDEGFVVNY